MRWCHGACKPLTCLRAPQFTDRGLNTFTSAVNFTALAQGRATSLLIPLQTFSFVALPLAPAGAMVQGTQRLTGAMRTANTGRRLFQAASGAYAQASALASFAPLDKSTAEASPPPPATVFSSW